MIVTARFRLVSNALRTGPDGASGGPPDRETPLAGAMAHENEHEKHEKGALARVLRVVLALLLFFNELSI